MSYKKSLYSIILVLTSFSLFGQEELKVEKRNELKINAGSTFFAFPELTYERIINKNQSIGVSYAFSAGIDDFFNYVILPYYRFYFGEKITSGFFLEVNGAFFSDTFGDEFRFNEQTQRSEEFFENEYGLGLGGAIGVKILTKRNRIVEFHLGAGRNLLNTDKISKVYPRFGITVGKRF